MVTEIMLDERPLVDAPRVDVDSPPLVQETASAHEWASIAGLLRSISVIAGPSILFHLATLGSLPALFNRRVRPLSAVGTAILAGYWLVARPWHLRWGATDDEVSGLLPGDDDLPAAGITVTRAVTIDAPADDVWPWLAQLGQDRGGFYSYEWLENLAGCQIENADRIHPEWQQREPGELVYLHPQTGLKVSRFEPQRVLGLEHWGNYVVEPANGGKTRLIARSRVARGLPAIIYLLTIEIPHFIMERRMLLGIKERAERQTA